MIQRYDEVEHDDGGDIVFFIDEVDDGRYALYVDYEAANARADRLAAEVKAWREHAAIRYMGKTQYDGDQFTAIRKAGAAVDAAKDLEQ